MVSSAVSIPASILAFQSRGWSLTADTLYFSVNASSVMYWLVSGSLSIMLLSSSILAAICKYFLVISSPSFQFGLGA